MSRNSRVYVGKLSSRTREGDLYDIFSRYGSIRSVDVKNGYAFIDFEDYRDAEDAIYEMDDREVDGSYILVQPAKGGARGGDRERDRRGGPPQRGDYRVYVEGIPRDMSWQDLKDVFRPVAEVAFTDVFRERGTTKGVVEFRTREEMSRAMRELDETKVRDHVITLREDRGGRNRRSRSRSPRDRKDRRSRSRSPRRSASRSPRRSGSRSPRRSASKSPTRAAAETSTPPPANEKKNDSPSPSPRRSRSRSPTPDRKRDRSPSPSSSAKRRKEDDGDDRD